MFLLTNLRKRINSFKGIFCLKISTLALLSIFLNLKNEKLYAQSKYSYQQLDNSTGLSNSCLNVVFQDSDDLMWFGTWDGLNMYDGSSFHVFNYSQGNLSGSIGSNIIYQIKEDKYKNIWIATIQGISRYNKLSGTFNNYFYRKNVSDKVVDKGFLLAQDLEGVIYGTAKSDLSVNYFDNNSQNFKKCSLPDFKEGKISKILIDDFNRLWIFTQGGSLQVYQKKNNSFYKVKGVNFPSSIADIFLANKNIFFVTSAKQLFKVNQSLDFKQVADIPHPLKTITFYKGNYLLAWSSNGMSEYDVNFRKANNLSKELDQLKGVRITSLKVSTQNILWIGTDGNGVIKIAEKQNHFGLVKQLPGLGKINNPIRAFNEVDKQLWIGTKGNGIITINNLGKANETSRNIKIFYSASNLLDNCVYSIQKGKDEFVYVGSDALGVTLYDLKKKIWYQWDQILGNKKFAPFNSVHSILIDKDSTIWMGLETYGLIHLKIKRNKTGEPEIQFLKKYPYTGNRFGPGNNVIYTLENGNDNQLYVGCRYGGLSIFNKKNKTFRNINAFSYKNSLSNNDVLSLFKDNTNKLWVGTSYGLNYISERDLNSKEPIFQKITKENGLPNNTVHTITQDNEGFIWGSTNKGLVKIDPKTFNIVRYKESDGLQSNEFSDNAVWKNQDGYLFFGGIYGFNYFLPKDIKSNNFLPNLLLSEIQLAGLTESDGSFAILNSKGNTTIKDYVLAPGDNYFELSVKAIDFKTSEKCQYAYFLEGIDNAWHYLGENSKITYSNITPGNYKLKLKWSNGSGVWTNETVALNLHFKQYFWLTWIAFLGYTLLLASGLYVFYNYRRNKIKMQYQLSVEHMLREKDEEVHQEQLNFFTNIAHELQTPLTLILGSLERYFLKSKVDTKTGHNHFLSTVNHQASRLNYLVNQLLEFRKAEAGHLRNHYSFVNISKLLINISNLFSHLNDESKYNYSIAIEPEIEIWTDKDKLEKIIFNLLSNAFKHTQQGNSISFSVHTNEKTQKLEIKVSNTGYNLTEKELASLFNRFFVVDDTQQSKISSGIGLAFTKELVNILNGDIKVTAENDWINFIVTLPLNYIPSEEEKLKDNIDKLHRPSYLLTSLTSDQHHSEEQSILKNNKDAVLNGFDKQEKKSILIVEDEPSIRYLLKDILKESYNIYEAENGKKGLEILRKVIPNLIISDIMMPDMSGLELCNIIKNTPETCHIPFIILSARGTIEQKNEGYEAGADAYIPKPFHTETLLLRVRKLLEYQQKLHDLFNKDNSPIKIPEIGMKENDKEFLERTIALIEEKLDDESLDAVYLEDKLGMSKANFYRKLKALSNMTPGELIKSIRLQEASMLLENSELTVSEIFYKTGFGNQSYFFREFKKKYNASPAEYRANRRLPTL